MSFSTLAFRRLHPDARLPTRAHWSDAGLDLGSIESHVIPAGEVAIIPTGLVVAIPIGFYGQIEGRSGLAAKGMAPLGGIIDSGYSGEIRVILHNTTAEPVTVGGDGKGVAQLVIKSCELPRPIWSAGELAATERGTNGFGSTDKSSDPT